MLGHKTKNEAADLSRSVLNLIKNIIFTRFWKFSYIKNGSVTWKRPLCLCPYEIIRMVHQPMYVDDASIVFKSEKRNRGKGNLYINSFHES